MINTATQLVQYSLPEAICEVTTEVFKSLLFKYEGKLFLGYLNAEKEIDEFKQIEYNVHYDDLGLNQFVIVLVEKNESKYKLYDLNKITVSGDYDPDEDNATVVIGEVPNPYIFALANDVLENNKDKIVYH